MATKKAAATSTRPKAQSKMKAALGGRFREVRTKQEVYLRPLAKKMKVSINTIRWHEAGDRMLRTDQLVEAAKIMKVQPAELLVTL